MNYAEEIFIKYLKNQFFGPKKCVLSRELEKVYKEERDLMKEDEVGGTCGTHGEGERCL
jgi:hypothetical protein